jgi:hypothetical protein
MIKNYMLRVFLIAFSATLILGACQKSVFDEAELADHSAEFAFPVFSTSIELKDLMLNILNDTLSGDTIQINPDQTMTLYYSGDVAQKKATDIFTFFQTGILPIADTSYYAPFEAPDSVKIYKVILSGGTAQVVILNTLPETVTGTFYIPQMTKDGVSFSMPFTIPPIPTFPWISPVIDLEGWELASDNNSLYFRYEAYLPDGTRVQIPESSPGTAGVGFVFQDMTFYYMEGYWGYEAYPLTKDTIEIDINQTSLQGDVHIVDPKVTMTVSNSWGFPTRGVVQYLSFIGRDGQEYELESTVFNGDSLDFNYPSWIDGEVGQTKDTHYFFDKTNSNIDDIFNAQPTSLIYEVVGVSNAQLDPNITGFITDSSVIKLRLAVEMVLEGSVRNFGADQTLNLNFGEFSDIDTSNIESVEFKLVTENGTPIATKMQMYFQFAVGKNIDSLFIGDAPYVLEAAPIDGNGVATGITRTEQFIPMTAARFDRIRTATQGYLRTWFTTADGGNVPVKLLANQQAIVKMGLKVKTRL